MNHHPYPTPHIQASPEDFAKTVLMPGDPLRSEFIAKTFLENARLINNVRGVQGYTGRYLGREVSVMASGMGMPSMGIYAYELYHFFEVENIIRVGSAGAMSPSLKVRDIVLGLGSCTDSAYARGFHLPGDFAPTASFDLLLTAAQIAKEKNLPYAIGNLLSSDQFYNHDAHLPEDQRSLARWRSMDVLAVEMESAALYLQAAAARGDSLPAKALAICTISDHLITGESTTASERQNSFTGMMELALETACRL